MRYKGAINEKLAKKTYPTTVMYETFTVKDLGMVDRVFFVMTREDEFGLCVRKNGVEHGYIGTRKELADLIGEKDIKRLISKCKQQWTYCIKCHKPIANDGYSCYCDSCRDKAKEEDVRKLDAWTMESEIPGVGFYAIASATIKQWAEAYDKALDDYVENPFDSRAIRAVKSMTDGEGFLLGDEFSIYTMGQIDPIHVRDVKRRHAMEKREKKIRKRIRKAVRKETAPLKEEIEWLNKEVERLENEIRARESEQRKGQEV